MNRKPSIILDTNLSSAMEEKLKTTDSNLANGIDIPLTPADKSVVVYRKFEGVDPSVTDVIHHGEWLEETVVHNNISVFGNNLNNSTETRGINEDDGVILRFIGKPNGEIAMDTKTGRMLTEEQQELEEEALGIQYPTFKRWEFRLDSAKLTDGPERRMKLHQTYEERKNDEQSSMLSNMDRVFKTMFDRFDGESGKTGEMPVLSEDGAIELLMTQYSGDQIKAMVDMKEVDQEHTEQIMESSAMPEAVEEDSDMAKLVADGILEETKSTPKKRGRPRGSANA
jgi:hypothetical protein|tara:strand:- start:2219 stop:3067 length:849 start_codon:yes stop_codon:yes gene_type:complete